MSAHEQIHRQEPSGICICNIYMCKDLCPFYSVEDFIGPCNGMLVFNHLRVYGWFLVARNTYAIILLRHHIVVEAHSEYSTLSIKPDAILASISLAYASRNAKGVSRGHANFGVVSAFRCTLTGGPVKVHATLLNMSSCIDNS